MTSLCPASAFFNSLSELPDAAAASREARAGAADLAFEMASRGAAEVMTVEVSDVAGAMVYAARLQFDEAASAD